MFYTAQYPVHWTAESTLHFTPLADLFIPAHKLKHLHHEYHNTPVQGRSVPYARTQVLPHRFDNLKKKN